MADEISDKSPEFLFGQILERIEGVRKEVNGHAELLTSIEKALTGLPCKQTLQRLDALEGWQKGCKSNQMFQAQSALKLKHAFVIAFTASILSVGGAVLAARIIG